MSNAQLYKAIANNKYIIVHNWLGMPVGINCKICLKLQTKKQWETHPNHTSHIEGYYPCSFQEYISKKIGFI